MASGEQTIDDVTYCFQEDGRLLSGWNGDYLYDEQGFAITAQYVEIEEGRYVYVDDEGRKVTGWQTINGRKHYFDEDGIMLTGTIEVDGERYELDEYGVLYTGWTYDAQDNAYYHDRYGKLLKDTEKEIDGIVYVFDEEGIAKEKAVVEAEKKAEEEKKRQEEEAQRREEEAAEAASGSDVHYDVNGNGIAEAALAQLGRTQDCTMLVTNALAANGIYYHGWPAGYLSLGTVTDDPQPGDLIYYADGGMGMAHIAVYIGNGQAVHGGFNGSETVVASAYLGSGPVFIHIS
ncbi:MAG: NlpC/P60 family protein [Merdibacter sp.]